MSLSTLVQWALVFILKLSVPGKGWKNGAGYGGEGKASFGILQEKQGRGTPGLCSCQFTVSSPLGNSGAYTQGLARAHPHPEMLLESLLLVKRDGTGYHRIPEGSSSGQVLESPLGREVSKAGVLSV